MAMLICFSQAIPQKTAVPFKDPRLHILNLLPHPPLVRLLLLPLDTGRHPYGPTRTLRRGHTDLDGRFSMELETLPQARKLLGLVLRCCRYLWH